VAVRAQPEVAALVLKDLADVGAHLPAVRIERMVREGLEGLRTGHTPKQEREDQQTGGKSRHGGLSVVKNELPNPARAGLIPPAENFFGAARLFSFSPPREKVVLCGFSTGPDEGAVRIFRQSHSPLRCEPLTPTLSLKGR